VITKQAVLVLLGVTLFGCLGGIIPTFIRPAQYTAEAYDVVYATPENFARLIGPDQSQQITEIYQAGVLQDSVIAGVRKSLPQYTAKQIAQSIRVSVVAYTPLTRITATASSADGAATLANTVALSWALVAGQAMNQAYLDTKNTLQARADDLTQKIANTQQALAATDPSNPVIPSLQSQLKSWQDALTTTNADIESLDTARLQAAGNAWVAVRAKASDAIRSPDPVKNLTLGIAIGFSLGLLLALWLTSRRWRHQSAQIDQKAATLEPTAVAYEAPDGW
jgi:capsular polysaccharide biosynthesis protein